MTDADHTHLFDPDGHRIPVSRTLVFLDAGADFTNR
jgi:hypothetical protein